MPTETQTHASVQYGHYFVTEENPSREIIRAVKRLCVESMKKTAETFGARPYKIRIMVRPEYEMIDPETWKSTRVGVVAWKAYFPKGQA